MPRSSSRHLERYKGRKLTGQRDLDNPRTAPPWGGDWPQWLKLGADITSILENDVATIVGYTGTKEFPKIVVDWHSWTYGDTRAEISPKLIKPADGSPAYFPRHRKFLKETILGG